MKKFKHIISLFIFVFTSSVFSEDQYLEKIQPIFNNRCVACHGCYDAPCQLNLQGYEGFERGATKQLAYNGTRVHSAEPTRMWIDAFSEKEWRKKGFFSVNNSKKAEESIFYQMISRKKNGSIPEDAAISSNSCVQSKAELNDFFDNHPDKGMPYGLPKLQDHELKLIKSWIEAGASGPTLSSREEFTKRHNNYRKDIKAWEFFLNQKDNEHKLVARYMYEHLFLAHISFSEKRDVFFKLIRTDKPCDENGREIHTRTPNGDPKVKDLYYCFRPNPGTIVAKTHIPIVLNGEKFKRYQEIFFKKEWKATKLPTYESSVSGNPFLAFKDIPARARYEYLLEDARYHISTFIKGPVCNGSAAVNSIQEHFFVGFIDPEADVMLVSDSFEIESRGDLLLPGVYGSDVKINETPTLIRELTSKRETYRLRKKNWLKTIRPKGLSQNDLWKGNTNDPKEAKLTVFRHDDNAVVVYDWVGDISKTLFFLDYSLFERLVYNLVVNFDVFGNIGHQTLTRVYMDLIRMEAEENFLAFLPPTERKAIRDSWYRGYLTKLMIDYIFPDVLDDYPTNVNFHNPRKAKAEFVQKFWRPQSHQSGVPVTLAKLGENNFANYFPELTFLRITGNNKTKVYSIIRNREHENISWILGEEFRLAPEEDSLTLIEGFAGAYPNLFLTVADGQLANFLVDIKLIKTKKDFNSFIKKYGVNRTDDKFWDLYDSLNSNYSEFDKLEAGVLDLTRYGVFPIGNPEF